MRFGVAVKNLVKFYPDMSFANRLKDILATAVEISQNPSQYPKDKSETYLWYFMEQNPDINLAGHNPFYVLHFSDAFKIDFIFVLIEECKQAGILPIVLRGDNLAEVSSEQNLCAFDLFDDRAEKGFSTIKPLHI